MPFRAGPRITDITIFVIFRKHQILTQRRRKAGVLRKPAWIVAVTGREKQQKGDRLLTLWNRFAGPLLGRDGFDDELPAIFRVERHFRAVHC